MEKRKLLIADASEEFCDALEECLKDGYCIRVCREGNEALRMLEAFRPDAVILDLLLPGMDGVTLLQRAAERGLQVPVLATTRFLSDFMLNAMERLGIGYVMVKPCEISAVAARLQELLQMQKKETQDAAQRDVSASVDTALRQLGVQTHPRGYACLRHALMEAIREPGQQVTKTLYPKVGKICGGNAKQVERAIRLLIRQAWLYRNPEVWNAYFSMDLEQIQKCPTNKMFICTIAGNIMEKHMDTGARFRKVV